MNQRVADIMALGQVVADKAFEIFADCEAADDFCIQEVSVTSAVFGGMNRLCWSPKWGFQPDIRYCTDAFIELYNRSRVT